MEATSRCSRKRLCDGAALHLNQISGCKRRYKEQEEEMKLKRQERTGKENRDPGEHLHRTRRTQSRNEDQRVSKTRTRTRSTAGLSPGTAFRPAYEIQSCRPEVRVALIKKTTIQTSVQVLDYTDPAPTETHLDQSKPTTTMSGVRSRSTAVSDDFSGTRTTKKRSDRLWGPGSCRGDGAPPRIRSSSLGGRTEIRTKRRRKIHPSAFRGRGQLRLSITPEGGQLVIHIHEARRLMGKSCRSCDSYVKLTVTSDLHRDVRMKTQLVPNNKNPEYNQSFKMCIRKSLLPSRVMISVVRRLPEIRRSQLIGCMSFGIGSLMSSSKLMTGWFYLLGEEFGQSKHLRVTSPQSRPIRSPEGEMGEKGEASGDLRRTPDSVPDADLSHTNRTSTVGTTNQPNCTTSSSSGPKESTQQGPASSQPLSLSSPSVSYSSYMSTLYANNLNQENRGGSTQRLMVNIVRGKDGFGFTICSDCPVRVQAVDAGGPAHRSGLCQGDSVLQLNGLPVETWTCADLAHAIRSCPTQIVLVVWRGLPEFGSRCEALLRPQTHNTTTGSKLLSHPSHSKHGRRWGQGLGVRSSLGALGSLWKDRKEDQKEDQEEEDQELYSSHTTTLKGTRVTSSNGDNYIILSPVNPGEQLLQPVFQDRNGTIGRLYQTHPSRSQNLPHNPRPWSKRRPFTSRTSTLPPPPSKISSSVPSSNYSNYQNCTIVQSHLPHSGYGPYTSLAPKTLIFPIFVQPLDLCSPNRTLLLSEEMILHQADLLPTKVTVLIYSDLLLFTREDEAGRCNVLQSPLYMNTVQLREVPSEPLHIYFLQSSQSCWHCLFSLEAFSIEQKVRVSLCLHDNIQLQLVATETRHSHQLSDLPSDFGHLSLGQSDLLYHPPSPYSSLSDPHRPPSHSYSPRSSLSCSTPPPPSPAPFPTTSLYTSSSPPSRFGTSPPQFVSLPSCSSSSSSSTLRSPVWKERGEAEEEERRKRRREEEVEERQQGEGESASETSENVGGVVGRGFLLSPPHFNLRDEEEEESDEEEGGGDEEFFTYRPAVLQRSLSEGSLLQEPRSPRFLSDSTIHRLTRTANFNFGPSSGSVPQPPSPQTLRKHLTREGTSLHHMLQLLNGNKGGESRKRQLIKKNKSLAADVRSRLAFLRRRKNGTSIHGNSLEKALKNNRPPAAEVLRWADSLEALLANQYGLAVFRHFLRSEFSEENLDFWLAVERFKMTRPFSKMTARAGKIYEEFISTNAARQVNVDSSVRDSTNHNLYLGVHPASFQLAQDQIFSLMEADSYPRFLKSLLYAQLANPSTDTALEPTNLKEPVGQS
ncbi:regulator of G-protein signaling 3-like isoform X2 [Melanotaenia boesemani]|uniref:regulator of G-protein signaling 3-like isoform X2 n=1 Tax=Melanotaenia boesemani TaxID=1250792 RepID=UPI001C03F0C6|nr:regulator of G-protein signaling 3-like isoform X2 [Melanotaenia boesemani]